MSMATMPRIHAHDAGAPHRAFRFAVLGHRGMVGSAMLRALAEAAWIDVGNLADVAHTRTIATRLAESRAEVLFVCAARVGGIQDNIDNPVEFLRENLAIEMNVLEMAHYSHIRRVVFFGSSCIYPRGCPQPIREEYLMTAPLEPTNEFYALAKIAGIKLCEAYRRQFGLEYLAVMPCNLYGPGDHYERAGAHVIPMLMRRFHEAKLADAKTVTVWGDGSPLREFMHVDDLAACVRHLVDREARGVINIGTGEEISIGALATTIAETVGFQGRIEFDRSKPNGTPRKVLELSRIREYGWDSNCSRPLREGLCQTYEMFLRQQQ